MRAPGPCTLPFSGSPASPSASARWSPTTTSRSSSSAARCWRLLGENGAGKSTLVSILFGHYVADAGSIEVFGQPLPPGHPKAALAAGIGMVHQHFTLADNLSVLDNVLIGTEPLWRPWSHRREARAKLLRDVAAIRSDRQSGCAHRGSVGRRAPARGDSQGAVSRRPHSDSRRAHRRADAAGSPKRCSRRCARWWPTACRSSSSPTSSTRCWR